LVERANESQNYEFPALPASSPAGGLNTSARTSIRRKMAESALILDAANVGNAILADSE
jgi:hypothetical protein